MQWFRFYHEVLDDPKVQQLPPTLFKHWINLLCVANQNAPRGTLPCLSDVAFRLRLSEKATARIIEELATFGLIDRDGETLQPHNWQQRQRVSDSSAFRVAKHRSNAASNVTDPLPHARVTETDTDTDTENTSNDVSPGEPRVPPSPPFELFAAMCDELGVAVGDISARQKSKELGIAKRLAEDGATAEDIRHETRWLKGQAWLTGGIDMMLLEKQRTKWQLAGKPTTARQNGHAPPGPRTFFTKAEEDAERARSGLYREVTT